MPSISKRGDTYRIMVSLGYGLNGKQIRKTTTFTPPEGVTEGKGEKLAKAYAYEFEKHCQGMTNLNENLKFSELQKWYYEEIAIHKLKPTTYAANRYLMDLYVMPHIGHLRIKDINTAKIDRLFNELFTNGRLAESYRLKDVDTLGWGVRRPLSRRTGLCMGTLQTLGTGGTVTKRKAEKIAQALGKNLGDLFVMVNSGGGLQVGTIKRIRTALSPIFSTAVKKELIVKNPVTNATTPSSGEEKQKEFLDADQCRALLEVLDELVSPQLTKLIRMLLFTGMRVNELTALHWKDVDLDKAQLSVKHNLYRLGGEYHVTTPKTKSSVRCIALPPQVVQLLKEQREWQEQRKAEVGDKWVEKGVVFTGMFGNYINNNYINLQFKRLLERHDFPDVHIHDLRHANASLLINMGVPVKVISEHLGHKDTKTTENIYAHIFNETLEKASDAISKALGDVGI